MLRIITQERKVLPENHKRGGPAASRRVLSATGLPKDMCLEQRERYGSTTTVPVMPRLSWRRHQQSVGEAEDFQACALKPAESYQLIN
jgi:hypothetical protein